MTDFGQAEIEKIASVCHEANRRYCELLGDFSQKHWDDAPLWAINSAMNGVRFHLANPQAQASASHQSWLLEKELLGWVYGEKKDPDAKPPTHPCMVPFEKLPPEQQRKDHLFQAVVKALTKPL